MKRIKYGLFALLLVATSVASLAVSSETANATSNYDNVIQVDSALVLGGTDVTAVWYSDLQAWSASHPSDTGLTDALSMFADRLRDGGGWSLFKCPNDTCGGGGYGQLMVQSDPDIPYQFFTSINNRRSIGTTDASAGYVAFRYSGGSMIYAGVGAAAVGSITDGTNSYNGYEYYSAYPSINTRTIFINSPVDYPSGYEGALAPTKPAVVAMGDSFSSGEGNAPFEAGTDEDDVNECHRSPQAYPRLLQNDPTLDLGPIAFVACSGATTANVLYGGSSVGAWGEDPQIDALSENTEVVTITIGGNDVGFRDFAVACTTSICNFSTTAYSTIVDKISNDLPDSLAGVLGEIATRVSSTAKVYVIGYPHIAPPEMPTGFNSACWPLNGQLDDPDPELNDGATVRDVQTRLNNAISDAVVAIDDERFTYVDPNLSGSPFIDHDWCKEDRYFDIVTYNNVEHSFHPNVDGQIAYATIVKDAMD